MSGANKIMSNTAAMLAGLFPGDIPCVFLPYLVFLFDQKNYETIDYLVIQKDFFEMYDIELPPLVLQNLLNECFRQEYIITDKKTYFSNPLRIRAHKFGTQYKEAIKNFRDLKEKYKKFIAIEKGIPDVTDEELQQAVMHIIQYNSNFRDGSAVGSPSNVHDMLINNFMIFARDNYPDIVDIVNSLSVSNVLWDVVAHNGDGPIYFCNTPKIYFDTRCIFKLIGLEGGTWRNIYESFAQSIVDNGGSIIVYKHVLEEINSIIDNAKKIYKAENFDFAKASLVARQFRYSGCNDAKIDRIIFSLNKNSLVDYSFSVETKEYEQEEDVHQIDYEQIK